MKIKINKAEKFQKFIPDTTEFNDCPFRIVWQISNLTHEKIENEDLFDLKTEETASVIDSISNIDNYKQLIFGASDPFLRDDFLDILHYAVSKGLLPIIYIFNKYVTEKKLTMLKDKGITDILIICKDNDENLLKSLFIATQMNFNVHVRYEIHGENISKIGIVFEECKKFNIESFTIYFSHDKKRFGLISPSDMEDLYGFLYCSMIETNIYMDTDNCPQYRRYIIDRFINERHGNKRIPVAEIHVPGVKFAIKKSSVIFNSPSTMENYLRLKCHGLTAGDGIVFIDSAGKILPSQAFPIEAANIKYADLLETYKNSTLFNELRSRRGIKGKCKICPFIFICGGSRERAYHFSDNYLEEEPMCNFIFNKTLYR